MAEPIDFTSKEHLQLLSKAITMLIIEIKKRKLIDLADKLIYFSALGENLRNSFHWGEGRWKYWILTDAIGITWFGLVSKLPVLEISPVIPYDDYDWLPNYRELAEASYPNSQKFLLYTLKDYREKKGRVKKTKLKDVFIHSVWEWNKE
jgi:hypothetical protein